MAKAKTTRPKRRDRRAAARAESRASARAETRAETQAETRTDGEERVASPTAGTPDAPQPSGSGGAERTIAGVSRRTAAGAATLALLVAACYFPSLSGGFVWDDVIFSEEPVIRRWSGLWSIWFSPADIRNEGHYWPIVYTTFWLEHKLWGLAPFGYHAVNVLLHAVNTLLVWRLLRRLDVPGAWAVAAVFAVHPVHVESVAWIIERKDLLSGLFYLSAVLAWIRFTEAPHPSRYCLALALFTAGLLSKSIVVTLPAALLVWHWWKRGRVTGGDAIRLLPFFAVGLGITAGDLAFYTSREPLALGYSLAERTLIAARALWFYAGKLVWPTDLAVIYPQWDIRAADPFGWLYVAAAAGLAALLWFARHRVGRGPLAGAVFFAVTLAPVLGFVDFGYMQFSFVADRFQYLAGLGVMAVLIAGATRAVSRGPEALRFGAAGALLVVLGVLATLTWRQAGIYRDEITFFSHIVALNPLARDAHLNLGSAYFDANRVEEGYAVSLVAAEQRPDFGGAHANLGRALLLMERFDEAEGHLLRALELDPRKTTAMQNMAELRRKQGRDEEAIERFRKVIEREPANALAHAGLGTSLLNAERHEEALEAIDRALELKPGMKQRHSLLALTGRALKALGRFEEAERRLLRAAEMDRSDVAPLVDLAALRIAEERFDEADEHLRRALARAPGNTAALQNVAEALRKRGRYEKAVESYRSVLAIDPDFAMAHAGMGDALFRLERYEEAIPSLERSLELHSVPPTATARLVLLGNASRALDRPEAAMEYFERAVELDPRNGDAIDHLAMMRFTAKRYDEALALYRRMLEVRPRQCADPRQPRCHALLPGPARGGGTELRAGPVPGPGARDGAVRARTAEGEPPPGRGVARRGLARAGGVARAGGGRYPPRRGSPVPARP